MTTTDHTRADELAQLAARIRHDPDAARFRVVVDGIAGELDYRLDDDRMTILHTGVPVAIGGRGIAGELVRAALDHARTTGWKVHPACSYADAWMRKHPGYDNLRA